MTANAQFGYLQAPYLAGSYLTQLGTGADGLQFDALGSQVSGFQFLAKGSGVVGMQFLGDLNAATGLGMQFLSQVVDFVDNLPMEFKADVLSHTICADGGYLVAPYLTEAYLQRFLCAHSGMQFTSITNKPVGMQFLAAIYNTTNLRILCEFPSRGTTGLNWTANSTQGSATNDFTVNNLNTDIIEQIWRSSTGTITGIQLDCDTEITQGVFLDTLAMLNTNITRSATITLLGSNNAAHSPVGTQISLTPEEDGTVVYIAPDLPTTGFRYWRFLIDDNTNDDTFVSIGTIVFGASTIFQEECFVDQVVKTPVNFVDEVFTEAFTNVRNDRGIKNAVKLDFRNILFNGPNFSKIVEIFQLARTVLKCLWIPTPEVPTRFLTFAKLKKIPVERHNFKGVNNDYVTFTIETDESL